MGEIRKLQGEQEFDSLVDILANAYPGMGLVPADKRSGFAEAIRTRNGEFAEYNLYGYFRDGRLLGGMAMYDFEMSWFGEIVLPVGGVGMVAVDLLHKKERIAYDLLQFYLKHFRESGASLAVLYPFRPDFYKKMGFGAGTKMNRYSFSPSSLPKGTTKEHVVYLSEEDREEIVACYERFARSRHGLMLRTADEVSRLFPAGSQIARVGVREAGELRGYMNFYYEKVEESNFVLHNVVVREFVYETPEAVAEMLTFLRNQSDQFHQVIWHTQDEEFHNLLHDPRNGTNHLLPSVYHETNTQGVGVMYRVLNVPETLQQLQTHNFGGQTCQFHLIIEDSFLQERTSLQLSLDCGKLTVESYELLKETRSTAAMRAPGSVEASALGVNTEAALASLQLTIEDFSSLLMGSATLKSLYNYGAARLRDKSLLPVLHRAFMTEEKPLCMTAF